MSTVRFIVAASVFAALVFAAEFFGNRPGYYPSVVVDVPTDLQITFVRRPRATVESCQLVASGIANSISATCPTCNVRVQPCSVDSDRGFAKLLGEEPLAVPSARVP